jgi:cation transporter-like permease
MPHDARVGDVGLIVGSTATTKLASGTLSLSIASFKQHGMEIVSAWLASLILFILYGGIAVFMGSIASAYILILQLLAANFIAIAVIVTLAFLIVIMTYQQGWNPDNFVIPIESAFADGLTPLPLFVVLLAIQ